MPFAARTREVHNLSIGRIGIPISVENLSVVRFRLTALVARFACLFKSSIESALCLKPVIDNIAIEKIGTGPPLELMIFIEKCEEVLHRGSTISY